MAALDEFVSRARSQNDSYHQRRTEDLANMAGNAKDGFVQLEKDLNDCRSSTENFGNENTTHGGDMEALAASLQDDARPLLQDLQYELATSTFKDYHPTGETPQKREWEYPTHLPRTESHESIIARLRGLPDPAASKKTPSISKTPGRSPRKQQTSPRKGFGSPSKAASPSKTKVFMDVVDVPDTKTEEIRYGNATGPVLEQSSKAGLKEMDINVVAARPPSSMAAVGGTHTDDSRPVLLDFSKSLGSGGGGAGQPPLKRHATTNAIVESRLPTKLTRAKSTAAGLAMGLGVENFAQSVGGPGTSGRRLRSSPPG